MAELAEQLAPLEQPLSAGTLQCTDVVANLEAWLGCRSSGPEVDDSIGDKGETESLRVAERLKALRSAALALDAQQGLLERLVERGNDPARLDGPEEDEAAVLEQLVTHGKELSGDLKELEAAYAGARDELEALASQVVDKIAAYDAKRKELSGELATLRAKVCDGEESVDALEAQLAQLTDELENRKAQETKLHGSCEDLEKLQSVLRARLVELDAQGSGEDQPAEAAEAAGADAEQRLNVAQERLEWVAEVEKVLSGISGVAIEDFVDFSFTAVVKAESIRLTLGFNPRSSVLESVALAEPDLSDGVPGSAGEKRGSPSKLAAKRRELVAAITRHAVSRNDVRFAVREIRQLVANMKELDRELEGLRERYLMTISGDELVITLPDSVVATFNVASEYPQRYAPARLVALEAFNGWQESEMRQVVAHIQDEQAKQAESTCRISSLIERVLRRFETLRSEKAKA
mmetsp:Transcript_10031/g.28369  ORF Transcript_10031/g.28369 Transcript_10031/m.28369 type:complete len:464 (+) Transcript_10031:98-1489(+)